VSDIINYLKIKSIKRVQIEDFILFQFLVHFYMLHSV